MNEVRWMGWGGVDGMGWVAEDLLGPIIVNTMDKGFSSRGARGGDAEFGRDPRE